MNIFFFSKKDIRAECKQGGQSLVEVIVSVSLIFIALAALLALVAMSMRGSGFGTTKARAAKLSNEHMEMIRAYRDSVGWDNFYDQTTDGCADEETCYLDDNLSLQTGSEGTSDPFTYYFQVETIVGGVDKLRVVANVDWREHGGDRSISAKALLADWE